jgi:DNA-binding NtrC family response regulator
MDVLIVERDDLVAEVLADALADVGINAEIALSDDQALHACHDGEPRVVITSMNRSDEDLGGVQFGRAMRSRCPWLAVVYWRLCGRRS